MHFALSNPFSNPKQNLENSSKKNPDSAIWILYQQLHGYYRLTGFLQTCRYPIQAVCPLAFPKFAFNLVSYSRIASFLPPLLFQQFHIRCRPTQRRTIQPYTVHLAKPKVLSISVNLVCNDGYRVKAKSQSIVFSRSSQNIPFIKCIKAQVLYMS